MSLSPEEKEMLNDFIKETEEKLARTEKELNETRRQVKKIELIDKIPWKNFKPNLDVLDEPKRLTAMVNELEREERNLKQQLEILKDYLAVHD